MNEQPDPDVNNQPDPPDETASDARSTGVSATGVSATDLPATDLPARGERRVDEALEHFARLDDIDVVHHAAHYDDIHRTLAGALEDAPVDEWSEQ